MKIISFEKIVSFEVAKYLKEKGFPQSDDDRSIYSFVYPLEDKEPNYFRNFTKVGELTRLLNCLSYKWDYIIPYVAAPTYLEAWLWLWREKKIMIDIKGFKNSYVVEANIKSDDYTTFNTDYSDDPEEVIIAAIEYLVDNDLIK